ncbi:MAG: GHKL domain-containing protein [Flavisolibacter sp.]|nr:GHKL domain-containing protein [Flavisolibacter sp.]
MNQLLNPIVDLIQGESGLTEAGKETLEQTIKAIDRALAIAEFKLTRFEKEKKSLSILLEETIEELQKKTFAVEQANIDLTRALNELRTTQAQLIQAEKMASLGELTAGIAHEIQNPLNFVNNFSEVSIELVKELKDELHVTGLPPDQKRIFEHIVDDLTQNQEKIVYHGKRADAIVKGMLQHSRKSSGQKEIVDLNALIDEYLRLSYHGKRAKEKTFNATVETHFDEQVGKISVVPQDLGRVLLNLFNNAFYSVTEKKKKLNGGFEPTVSVTSRRLENKIEICVRDNGSGIQKSHLDKIFQPFFTTKPTGEGTGLGLSLSYDIITKGHGGELKVNTEEGEFAEFTILLPA